MILSGGPHQTLPFLCQISLRTLFCLQDIVKANGLPTGAKIITFLVDPALAFFIRDGACGGQINTPAGLLVVYHRGRPLYHDNAIHLWQPGPVDNVPAATPAGSDQAVTVDALPALTQEDGNNNGASGQSGQ